MWVCYSTVVNGLQRQSNFIGADVARDKLGLQMSCWEKRFAEDEIRFGANEEVCVHELF